MLPDLLLLGERVVTPEGVRPASIQIRDGKIGHVGPINEAPFGSPLIDCGDAVLMPGIVDTHVHINQPGREDWEGFWTATQAAAAGGITTLVDMPLNSIPATTTRQGLRAKTDMAFLRCSVDVGFWGGVVPGNTGELEGLLADGVLGFKAFLVPSGVREFRHVEEPDLRAAMLELTPHGAVLLVHAELPGPIEAAAGVWEEGSPAEYDRYLRSRPDAAEVEAVALLIRLCRETGCRVHVVHVSSAEALPLLKRAREEGLPITAETCPHYLTFAAEEIPGGAVLFKCAPPIRSRENRERLWQGLREGVIDLVATDHSPCPPRKKKLKAGDFREAWGGISSLQLALPAVWTGARERGFTVADLAEWMCAAPARLAGLKGRKGAIAPGYDADLVIWDPEASFVVEAGQLFHRHKLTPYAGRTLYGTVRRTLLNGEVIYERGKVADDPQGMLLLRDGEERLHRSRGPRGRAAGWRGAGGE
ncbi:MAG TPA: allantoinase AllB [Thermoanaerobaculia bacterium]|nr:allantoinase AllB [Thermoanaerobaculia bacterium]